MPQPQNPPYPIQQTMPQTHQPPAQANYVIVNQPQQVGMTVGMATGEPKPPNYLCLSIIVCLCCNCPCGIIALAFACKYLRHWKLVYDTNIYHYYCLSWKFGTEVKIHFITNKDHFYENYFLQAVHCLVTIWDIDFQFKWHYLSFKWYILCANYKSNLY